jgi:hypothetical protein
MYDIFINKHDEWSNITLKVNNNNNLIIVGILFKSVTPFLYEIS